MLRHRSGMVVLLITLTLIVVAVLAPVLAPYDALEMHPTERFKPPSPAFPLGTDEFGRDLLSRILMGARISLTVGSCRSPSPR
jgi:ABC-type dipeptide/oligopeptide/nickel transport system permease subunit